MGRLKKLARDMAFRKVQWVPFESVGALMWGNFAHVRRTKVVSAWHYRHLFNVLKFIDL